MSDAASDVGAGRGNFTIGHGQGGAGRRLAAAGVGDDGDGPEPIIGGLGESWRDGPGQNRGTQSQADAVATHDESDPQFRVMVRLIRAKCDENMLRRNWKKCSSVFNHMKVNLRGPDE